MNAPVDRSPSAHRLLFPLLLAGLPVLGCLLALGSGCSDGTTTIVGPGYDPFLKPDPHLSLELPVCGDAQLRAAWVDPSGEAWLAGSGGLVLHHRDSIWEREVTCTDATLTALVRGQSGLLAVGAQGTILRREGERWRHEESPTRAALLAAAAAEDGEVWVAGRDGTLLRRGPDGWHAVETPITADLSCLALHADTLLVGGGAGGLWWRAGSVWSVPSEMPPELSAELVQNVAYSEDAGWFLITPEALYRIVPGATWSREAGIWGTALCVVDSLLYAGDLCRVDLSSAGLPITYVPHLFSVAGVHGAGAGLLLAFGRGGEVSWYDPERDSFVLDEASALIYGQVIRCLDGSLLLRDHDRFLVEDGGRWRQDTPLPPDAHGSNIGSFDGYSARDYYCIRYTFVPEPKYGTICFLQHVVNGLWESILEVPASIQQIALTPDGVLLFTMNHAVYRVEEGTWSLEDSLPVASSTWNLYRTLAGDMYAVEDFASAEGAIYRRRDTVWEPVLTLSAQNLRTTEAVVGRYPDALYLLGHYRFLGLHRTQTDSLLVEVDYRDLVGLNERANTWAEGPAGIYIATAYPGHVLLLSGEPGSHRLEIVAGPLLDEVIFMAVGPDGSLVLVSDYTGRLYRLPAESLVP
jgi:hypothetical protein